MNFFDLHLCIICSLFLIRFNHAYSESIEGKEATPNLEGQYSSPLAISDTLTVLNITPHLAADSIGSRSTPASYIIPDDSTTDEYNSQNHIVPITEEIYDRLVYFSKVCALTNCISEGTLVEDRTFIDGGCPADLEFCSNKTNNPTIDRTRMELVLIADKGELGTGYVAVDHEKGVVMLVFRGSSTRQDWFSDFQIYPVDYVPASSKEYQKLVKKGKIKPCEGCQIHHGFNQFSKTLGRHFLQRVRKIFKQYPDYNLVVTGHSLGAALASLAGIELKLRGHDPMVLTYATPKMFNAPMKQWVDELFETQKIHEKSLENEKLLFHKGYFRVVHLQDYITMVPPFYKAAGLEIFISKLELPHCLEDVEYRGLGTGLSWRMLPSKVNKEGVFPDGRTLATVEHWLHMFEHRSYFILINECMNF